MIGSASDPSRPKGKNRRIGLRGKFLLLLSPFLLVLAGLSVFFFHCAVTLKADAKRIRLDADQVGAVGRVATLLNEQHIEFLSASAGLRFDKERLDRISQIQSRITRILSEWPRGPEPAVDNAAREEIEAFESFASVYRRYEGMGMLFLEAAGSGSAAPLPYNAADLSDLLHGTLLPKSTGLLRAKQDSIQAHLRELYLHAGRMSLFPTGSMVEELKATEDDILMKVQIQEFCRSLADMARVISMATLAPGHAGSDAGPARFAVFRTRATIALDAWNVLIDSQDEELGRRDKEKQRIVWIRAEFHKLGNAGDRALLLSRTRRHLEGRIHLDRTFYPSYRDILGSVVVADGLESEEFKADVAGIVAASERLYWNTLLFIGLLIGASVGVTVLLSRMILDPVLEVNRAAVAVSGGDLSSRVDVRSADELGDLAWAFNRMTASLSDTTVSQRYLQEIMDSMEECLLVLSEDGSCIRKVNRSACALLGYAENELVGLPFRSLLAAGDSPLPGAGAIDLDFRKKDGRTFPVQLSISPLKSAGNLTAGTVAAARDLTSVRRLEEELRQSQKLEAVGKLAGGIAHDFNNLLTAILGYAEMLSASMREGGRQRMEVDEIRKAGEKASMLTRQLLAFSRKQIMQPEILDLNDLIRDIEPMLRRLIEEDIGIRFAPGKHLRKVKADPGQIDQVILNLSINARDAMAGGGVLTIESRNVDIGGEYASRHASMMPGKYVLLAVSDNGHGMDGKIMKRIFEPFFTTKPVGKGTGLGLATVYGIVKQSGGNVWVYSEPGMGTTFKVYLPAAKEDAGGEPDPGLNAPDLPVPAGGMETILVVDDEEMVRNLCTRVLGDHGYRVLAAPNGKDALGVFEEHDGSIDILLTDVVMPGEISGKQLADLLVRSNPELQVLFMSGYSENAIVHHGVLDHRAHFLSKPFSTEVLAGTVRQILNRR